MSMREFRLSPLWRALWLAALVLALWLASSVSGWAAQPPPAQTATPTATPAPALGPDRFPAGVNPLTGLTVEDASLLSLPPALVSVSNFPVSARPQSGLSFAAYVFEMYIGEGMTRFLALYYGEFPQAADDAPQATPTISDAAVGPIRSGRLPYQKLRSLYNGFLVMASASGEVRTQLSNAANVFGSDASDINSALIEVPQLEALAQTNAGSRSRNLTGNLFSLTAPAGGQEAKSLWVFYAYLNQVLWEYDPSYQAYLRSQDKSDGSGMFYPSTDRLTGEQLAFENVIVLFVRHEPLNSSKTLIDLDLLFNQGKAYLFRDGMMYPIYWSTASGEYEKKTGQFRPIRFVDRQGNPIALKPGRTWVEIVDVSATLQEVKPSSWKVRFYAP